MKEVPLAGEPVRLGMARTHAGELPIYSATLQGDLSIGDFKLPTRQLRFTDVVPDPDATPRGQVGGEALRDFVLTLDSTNERMKLARPQ
jgi:hypothetical protein